MLFSLAVKANNKLGKLRTSVGLHLMARRSARTGVDEKRLYERLKDIVPEVSFYNSNDVIHQVRLRSLDRRCLDVDRYLSLLLSDPGELEDFRENLTFSGSHFFRGSAWPLLRDTVQSAMARSSKDRFRVWCAGCANGKEVYSVLMILSDLMPLERIELLATDYNPGLLEICKTGSYSVKTFEEIPVRYRHWTKKCKSSFWGGGDFSRLRQFRFVDSMRDMIGTGVLNLLTDDYPRGFDLILCRNVIKFFEPGVKAHIQKKLAGSLNPGGIIMISDELDREGFPCPASFGLTQVDGSCVYIKMNQDGD